MLGGTRPPGRAERTPGTRRHGYRVPAWFGYPDGYPPDDDELTEDQKQEYTGAGDWPPWPGAEQLQWMPQDVIDLGDNGLSMVSGPAVWFEPDQAGQVLAALTPHGFSCRRDGTLVVAAHSLQ